ncbi:MAG TPA: SDR family oxidoreductase [Verrucomicrobiae bacterium]|jgi:NAD(P)-dependent dehydrogenase (short-subunit alcohol dehydrogenase family)
MSVARLSKAHQKPPPPQKQKLPGSQKAMRPQPVDEDKKRNPAGRLQGKVAIITGADSGIGKSVALLFAREGADICIVYLEEHEDAKTTAARIEEIGRKVILCAGDIGEPGFCSKCVERTIKEFGKLDILVNNAGEQDEIAGVEDLSPKQVERTFKTNIFGFFYLTRAALPHLKEGASVINTTSVQAYEPSYHLMDYACTKAAILNFTRSLAKQLAPRKIRVNAVAPGPIWTPLIPASFPAEHLKDFGKKTLFKRPGQPAEVAPSYLFLAAQSESSFITGEVIHVNGGQAMPG